MRIQQTLPASLCCIIWYLFIFYSGTVVRLCRKEKKKIFNKGTLFCSWTNMQSIQYITSQVLLATLRRDPIYVKTYVSFSPELIFPRLKVFSQSGCYLSNLPLSQQTCTLHVTGYGYRENFWFYRNCLPVRTHKHFLR